MSVRTRLDLPLLGFAPGHASRHAGRPSPLRRPPERFTARKPDSLPELPPLVARRDDRTARVHSQSADPTGSARFRCDSGSPVLGRRALRPKAAMPSEFLFRPRGFSPPRRVAPRAGRRRCRLLPTLGFAAFAIVETTTSSQRTHPSEDITSHQHLRGHPRRLPPCRSSRQLLPLLANALPRARLAGNRRSPSTSRPCSDAWPVSAHRSLPTGRGPSSLGFKLLSST
jgi:hypothetical protein